METKQARQIVEQKQVITALIVAVIVLAIGEGYIIFTLNNRPKISSMGVALVPGAASTSPEDAPKMPAPNNLIAIYAGAVQSADANSIAITDSAGSAKIFAVNSNTSIVKEGAVKSAQQQDADMEAFHTYSRQLMKDPVKNQAALQSLIAPSPNVETKLSAAELPVGTQVVIFAVPGDTNGSLVAVKVSVPASN